MEPKVDDDVDDKVDTKDPPSEDVTPVKQGESEAEVRDSKKVEEEEDKAEAEAKPKAAEPESPTDDATTEEEDMKTNGEPAAIAKEKEDVAVPAEEDEGELDDDYYNSTSSALSEDRWEEMFQRMLDFKEVHGHCLVPNRYKEDLQLGAWVSAQRKNYKILESNNGKSTPMTMERAQRLVGVGFEWTAKNPRHLMWEVRFAELKDFKNNYGHAQVPIGWEQNVQLANWVSTQRQEYKNLIKGKTSRLNDKRVDMLNSLGFAWELQRGGRRRRLTVANKGNHPGAAGTPPGHPANDDDSEEGPPAKKPKVEFPDDKFAIDDGTPVRRSSTGRKRTTLKKKVTSVDESAKCILPGVAIMGGGREGGSAATPRTAAKRANAAANDPSRTSPNNGSVGSGGRGGGPTPFQQGQMQQQSMQMQQGQQQMHPQHSFSNEALLRMLQANGANPWQMLPNGAYQQMGNHPMAHQLMGGGNPFFPMAAGPFGMTPYGPGSFDGQRGMDPPQYPGGDGTDGGGSYPQNNNMSPQEMDYRRMQQQQGGGYGNNNCPNQPYYVPSSGGGSGQEQKQQDNNGGNGSGQQQNNNNRQQQMQGQGPGGMMQPQFGGPGGWNGMQMGQQGPFWNMNNMNMSDNPAAAAAAAAQHLQAAAALTAGMDERNLPPALAPLASVARQMNGMLGQQQGMNMNGNGGQGGGGGNSHGGQGGNPGGPQDNGNGGGGHNMMSPQNNGSMPNNMPNMANHVRGRRGDPPADPPTGAALANMLLNDNSTMKNMSMKQGIFEDADE